MSVDDSSEDVLSGGSGLTPDAGLDLDFLDLLGLMRTVYGEGAESACTRESEHCAVAIFCFCGPQSSLGLVELVLFTHGFLSSAAAAVCAVSAVVVLVSAVVVLECAVVVLVSAVVVVLPLRSRLSLGGLGLRFRD